MFRPSPFPSLLPALGLSAVLGVAGCAVAPAGAGGPGPGIVSDAPGVAAAGCAPSVTVVAVDQAGARVVLADNSVWAVAAIHTPVVRRWRVGEQVLACETGLVHALSAQRIQARREP